MSEEKKPQVIEVIVMPPLKMVLVHAKEERINNAILTSTGNDALKSAIQEEHIEPKALKKIIEHLEKKL
jgi:hypothetical protein